MSTSSPRVMKWARVGATIAVAVPAVGIGAAALREAGAEGGALSLNQSFHLGLGLAMLVLFCEFAVTISRSRAASGAVLSGVGGFVASLAGAITVELLGPHALTVLVIVAALWAMRIATRGRDTGRLRPEGCEAE